MGDIAYCGLVLTLTICCSVNLFIDLYRKENKWMLLSLMLFGSIMGICILVLANLFIGLIVGKL